MSRSEVITQHVRGADAEAMERDAGCLVAEICEGTAPKPLMSGTSDVCRQSAEALARGNPDRTFGVFRVVRTYRKEPA